MKIFVIDVEMFVAGLKKFVVGFKKMVGSKILKLAESELWLDLNFLWLG